MWQFCAALRAFAGNRWWIIAQNVHKTTSNADSSLNCLLCPVSIFSLPPSADCVLLWTATSSWLFSSALLCQLTLSVFSPTNFLRPLPVSWEISPSGPLCGFRAKPDKEILWPAPIQTERNATHCVTTLIILFNNIRSFKLSNGSKYFYVILIIEFRHKVKAFQALLFNMILLKITHSFIYN